MIQTPIRYVSTNVTGLEAKIADGTVNTVGLAEAIFTGQAPDSGLFVPTHFPQVTQETISGMRDMPYSKVFVEVMKDFFQEVLSESTLESIGQEAYIFEPFIEPISDEDYIARLDEGPTNAFKDYAAQVFFRTLEALLKEEPKTEIKYRTKLRDIELLTIITATSGDTGGAMGHACQGRDKMWMAILHSSRIGTEVSELQAKQMSHLGDNIYPIWIDTDFDGCQDIARRLQRDEDLQSFMNMTSANSINIGRLLPQIAYYFHIYSRVAENNEEIVFSVPSGNFGNAVAGLYAMRMGLPIKLLIGVNENDVFERFYGNGEYKPAEETASSPSNSMNVNRPSNMRRLIQLYQGQLVEIDLIVRPNMDALKRDIVGAFCITDEETHQIISDFYDDRHMIGDIHSTLEPHGAVAWGAALRYRQSYSGKIVSFETAHPGKFPESLQRKGIEPELPPSLEIIKNEPLGRHYVLPNNYSIIRRTIVALHDEQLRK